MKWCHNRQLFLKLQEDAYTPAVAPHAMSKWAARMADIFQIEVQRRLDKEFLSFDASVLELVSSDAISNGKKYGVGQGPWMIVRYDGDEGMLVVEVCNMAIPGFEPITEVVAAKIVAGEGPSRSSCDTDDELVRVSDGIGLKNAARALRCVGGSLRMRQAPSEQGDGRVTTVEIRVPATRVPAVTDAKGEEQQQQQRIQLPSLAAAGSSPRFQSTDAAPIPRVPASSLKGAIVEDSKILRKMYARRLFTAHLKATEIRMVGETEAEYDAAADVIMGRKTDTLEPADMHPVDAVTLDQDLGRRSDGSRMLGTDIAAKLHAEGFQGVACVLSGGSKEDLDLYLQRPGVDAVASKSLQMDEIAQILLDARQAKVCGGSTQ